MSKKKTSATEKAKKDKKKSRRQELIVKWMVRRKVSLSYCICRRGKEGFMIQCSDCNEWFHGECVRVTEQDADQIEDYIATSVTLV